jgi:hypothetical protein
MLEMTLGLASSLVSMMRPAPTASPAPNSSISTTYGLPSMVTGIAFWGMLIEFHCRRAISRTLGFETRACT